MKAAPRKGSRGTQGQRKPTREVEEGDEGEERGSKEKWVETMRAEERERTSSPPL